MEDHPLAPESQIQDRTFPWLIIGLGNPGEKYSETYHNVGFRVVRKLERTLGVRLRQHCGRALVSDQALLGGETVVLVEPQTYMNASGEVLKPLFERFGSALQDIIVVYDELALPIGKIRVRQKGSAGGHNGIKSLISCAGDDEFMRVRVGILPDREVGDVRDFVLSRVAKSDRPLLEQAEDVAVKAVESLLSNGIEKTMAAYNGMNLKEDSKDN